MTARDVAARRLRPSTGTMRWLVRAAEKAAACGGLEEDDWRCLALVRLWLEQRERKGCAAIHAAVLQLHRRFCLEVDHGKRGRKGSRNAG